MWDKTNEKEQLSQIIQEYDDVASHYESFSIASRGAIRPGEAKTHVYDKRYSGTKEFIAWTTRIRYILENSAVAGSDEANDIVSYIDSFKGFGEESKLVKLFAMLNALHENWDLLSQPHNTNTSMETGRPLNVMAPKFEFKCNDGDGSNKVFCLKNVSSVIVSNIIAESFDLIHLDNYRQNVLPFNFQMPTSLGPYETGEFSIANRVFEQRGVGYKEFRFVFKAEDEQLNTYSCVTTKNVEDGRNYMIGSWPVEITLKNAETIEDIMQVKQTKIFISHRGDDVHYATAVVDFLEDLGVVADSIVCTSVPEHLIPNGQKIYEWLRSQFLEYNLHMILLLSDKYYDSPDCLNEMGAAWVTKADSDVILLPGFAPEKMRGCIGSDTMAIHCDGKDDILEDRIKQLRNKVCDEFNLPLPNDRRWIRIRDDVIRKLRQKESETEGDIRQPQLNIPIFDVKIVALNQQIAGTAEVVDIWGGKPLPKHKNVRFQIELCNDVTIRNLKVFGRSIESGIVKQNKQLQLTVCYMESPDTRWGKSVFELSRASYPAGEDGIPKVVQLEYVIDKQIFQQLFTLGVDQAYIPGEQEYVIPKDIEKAIQMKERMRKEFLKPADKLKQYSREELWKHPEKKFISDEVIVISTECKDPKWNTDGGFGKYEIYDFCDDGLLCWDNTGFKEQVKYYSGEQLLHATANRMLCLPFEKVVAYDLHGNSGYNMPIIHADYHIGESPFRYYYRDIESETIIDNGVITEVMPTT